MSTQHEAGKRMVGTIPLLSYLPRIHNRFAAVAAHGVCLPFQLGLCYKDASVADGARHLSPVGSLTVVQKGVRRMEFASDLQGAFTFLPQERVIFGKGSVAQLATEIDRLGCQRAFVITGTTIATKTDLLRRVQEVLGPRFVEVFYPIAQHTPRPDVVAAAARARAVNADVLVSLGGGSPVDGTKGVALCLAEDISTAAQLDPYRVRGPRGLRFTPQYKGKPIPHIAVTTTLSAGEFTSGVGITDPVRGVKESFGAPQMTPRIVILDPEMTVDTPAWLWASTGMRAVDHAVERLYSPKHNPLSDTLCQQALRYLFQHLPRATHDPAGSRRAPPLSAGGLDVDHRLRQRAHGYQPCDWASARWPLPCAAWTNILHHAPACDGVQPTGGVRPTGAGGRGRGAGHAPHDDRAGGQRCHRRSTPSHRRAGLSDAPARRGGA